MGLDEIRMLEETNHRLRMLHGVLDMALLMAGDVIAAQVQPDDRTGKDWHDDLLQRAVRQLGDQQVFEGRWVLYDDDEVLALRRAMLPLSGDDPVTEHRLVIEIDAELRRRNIDPLGGVDASAH